MIIVHRKSFVVGLMYILYFGIVLFLVSILTQNPQNWIANVSSDLMFVCQITPTFLMGEFFIDETIKKTSITRTGSRKKGLFLLLVQQYFFAWVFLILWIFAIILSARVQFLEEVKNLQAVKLFIRDYLGFLLMIHVAGILKRTNIRGIAAGSYIFVLVVAIVEVIILPKINRYFNWEISFIFSWINYKDFKCAATALIILNIFSFFSLIQIEKRRDIF